MDQYDSEAVLWLRHNIPGLWALDIEDKLSASLAAALRTAAQDAAAAERARWAGAVTEAVRILEESSYMGDPGAAIVPLQEALARPGAAAAPQGDEEGRLVAALDACKAAYALISNESVGDIGFTARSSQVWRQLQDVIADAERAAPSDAGRAPAAGGAGEEG